jgi:SPP1 gp7 family putative phage head morphogenesis protein
MPAAFLFEPTPHAEAAKWLRDKPVVSRQVFDGLLPELRARAFLVSGVEDANVAAEIREIVAKLPEGMPWEQAKREIASKLGPWLSGEDSAMKAARARAEIILRTHGFQAYQVTSHKIMRAQEDVFPFWQYLSLGDEKVRPAHIALNLKVAPADAPFWHDHSPPWQWGCRCRKVPLLPDEVDEMLAEDQSLPPERHRVLQGAALKLAEQGRMYNAAGQQLDIKSDRQKGKPGGFVFDPDALTLPLSDLKARYDPVTWSEFESSSKGTKLNDGRTVWSWLNGAKAKAGKVKPASLVTPTVPAAPPAATAPAGGSPLVSAALDLTGTGTHQPVADRVNAAIDKVHTDGVLPMAQVKAAGVKSLNALGDYHPVTNDIRFANDGTWPHLTLTHEIGHFLDRRALGDGHSFGSQQLPDADFKAWWDAVSKSPTFQGITPREAGGQRRSDYFRSPWEAWARCYAQFIASESQDPELMADLDRVSQDPESWRQWSTTEFEPIAKTMRTLFKSKGWMK